MSDVRPTNATGRATQVIIARSLRAGIALALATGCRGAARELASVHFEPVVTLGSERGGDGGIAGDPRVSARAAAGFRVVIPAGGGIALPPMVFADKGRFLGALHGGKAVDQQLATPVFTRIGPGDSIWVFDGAGRVLVSGPDRVYARTIPLTVSPWDAAILGDGRIVVASATGDSPFPLLLVDANGAIIRRIGATDTTAAELRTPRWIALSGDGTFWSVPMQFRWRLEHWDTTGSLLGAIERDADWFPPYSRVNDVGSSAPQPTIQGAWVDASNRIWLLGRVADPYWRTGLGPSRGAATKPVIVDPDRVYDTMLEAFDLTTRQVVAAARTAPWYRSVAEPGIIIHVREAAGGWKLADLVRVAFDGDSGKGH